MGQSWSVSLFCLVGMVFDYPHFYWLSSDFEKKIKKNFTFLGTIFCSSNI